MEELLKIFRYLSAYQVILTAILFAKSYRIKYKTGIIVSFLICVSIYLICPDFRDDIKFPFVSRFLYVFTFMIPFLFWMSARVLFRDKNIAPWYLWLNLLWIEALDWIYYFGVISKAHPLEIETGSNLELLVGSIPYLTQIIFTVLAIFEAFRNQKSDLLNSRIKVRKIFISLVSVLLLMVSSIELSIIGKNDKILFDVFIIVFIFSVCFIIIFNLMFFHGNFLTNTKRNDSSKNRHDDAPKVDEKYHVKLLALIEEKEIFLDPEASVSTIAKKINLVEYKTRNLINKKLGFRNFNAFLNHHRITHAKNMLKNEENEDLAIIDIAFKSGFNSLAPFNKAFKDIIHVTPSEFRKAI